MITKQQALEFIDELSKSHKVFMDLEHGKFYVNTYITIDEDILGDYGFDKGGYIPLELAVWLFIKENINSDLLKEFKQIPVDVDMLEVGQKYKIKYDSYGDIEEITDKFEKIILDKSRRSKYIYFKRSCSIYESLILEIYKVNKCR